MSFSDWLKARQGKGNESVDLVAPSILEHPKAWDGIKTTAEAREAAKYRLEASDEVAEAVVGAFAAYQAETGAETPAPNPGGLPYAPGARTTLADARLQLVCAAVTGSTTGFDNLESEEFSAMVHADLAVKIADAALKVMKV